MVGGLGAGGWRSCVWEVGNTQYRRTRVPLSFSLVPMLIRPHPRLHSCRPPNQRARCMQASQLSQNLKLASLPSCLLRLFQLLTSSLSISQFVVQFTLHFRSPTSYVPESITQVRACLRCFTSVAAVTNNELPLRLKLIHSIHLATTV